MKRDKNAQAVLILENDIDLADSIRLYLEDSYRVYVTRHSSKLLRYITRYRIKLILTDVDTPSIDLQRQLAEIKSSNPDVKIMLMYMFFDEEGVSEKSLLQSADDYISKPFDADVLKQKLDRLLNVKSTSTLQN